MSEEITNEVNAENPQVSLLKVYIKKQEELIADFCRRLINAEMNLEIATNSFTQAQQRATTAEQQIQQFIAGLQQVTAERNDLREAIKNTDSNAEEYKNTKAELTKAVKQRDDYYREMQHHIVKGNQLAAELEKVKGQLAEFTLKEQLEESAPRKKVAKVK